MRHRLIFFQAFLIVLSACNENDISVRGYPKVTTLPVINITINGALFQAEIDYTDLNEIIDHGFVWGEGDDLSIEKSDYISLGHAKETVFNEEIHSSLEVGVTYKVRSYVKTSKKTIYGKLVEFISLGSSRPVIYQVNPNSGSLGDTIVISGKNFRVRDDKILVKFSEAIAPILSYNDSTVKTIVPSCNIEKVKVKVVVLNNDSQEMDFTYLPPIIETIYPEHPSPCDTVTIVGKGFTNDLSNLILKINGEQVSILNSSSTKMQFLQPHAYESSVNLSLTVYLFTIEKANAFDQIRPEIISINNPVSIYDTLVIKGKNFPTCYPLFAHIIDTYSANPKIILNTNTEIHLTLSEFTCLPSSFIITFFSGFNFSTPPIKAKKQKIFFITPDSATFNETLIITGQDFSPGQTLNVTLPIYQNSQLINMISLPIVTAKSDELLVSIPSTYNQPNGQILDLIINGCNSDTLKKAFHLKHPVIGNFNPSIINDLSQIITISGQNFNPNTALNEVYIGNELLPQSALTTSSPTELKVNLSNLFNKNISKTESAKIKIQSGGQIAISSTLINFDYSAAWTGLSNFPGTLRRESHSFSMGNFGFIGLGKDARTGQLLTDFWSFDPSQNRWTKINDFPGLPRTGATCLVINGKAYVGLGFNNGLLNDWWEFNPASGQWAQKASLPAPARSNAYSFSLINKGYVGGGVSASALDDFWEFDPVLNTWTSKPTGPSDSGSSNSYFEFNNIGYCYQVSNSTSLLTEYSYDPIQNKWSNKEASFNFSGGGWGLLRYDTYLIGIRGDAIFKINPLQGSMEILPNFHPVRFEATSFVINNIGFVGLGYGNYNYNNSSFEMYSDFWSFEPSLLK